MTLSVEQLTGAVLNSIESQISVIDRKGDIIYVNQAWIDFGVSNGLPPKQSWIGTSYLEACMFAAGGGDPIGSEVLRLLQSLLDGRLHSFDYEYPCHSPEQKRWFMMRVLPVQGQNGLYVVSHHVITERKLAEQLVEQQNRELERLATVDKLTQLLNRHKIDEVIEAEIERAKRYHTPLALVMVDIDFFKDINDTFGHRSGDFVLSELALLMRNSIRRSDVIGRWGGEEFLILMPASTLESARRLAEKLRKKIRTHVFDRAGHITCSFGIAEYKSNSSAAEFIESADNALYHAKQNGRNRVELEKSQQNQVGGCNSVPHGIQFPGAS